MVSSSLPRWVNPLLEIDAEARDFSGFAERCPHRVIDNRGASVCAMHESSPGECAPGLCPLFEKAEKIEKVEKDEGGA